MAVFACQFAVHTLEFKLGVLVVIEFDLEPAALGMASVAFFAVIPAMGVVHFVAKKAIRRGIGVTLVGMAIRANDIFVPFFQFEIGFVMVEARGLPGLFDVAILAQLAQAGFVPVVIAMTVDTVFGGFTKL